MGVRRELHSGQRDVSLENAGKTVITLGTLRPKRNRSRDVGRTVEVLATRIDEKQFAIPHRAIRCFGNAVVDDRSIRA